MKSPELTEFFSLLGKAKKEKKEEFDNLLKEADINLDVLTSTVVTGIKEAKINQKKQKKKEEKLIEQLDSIIDTIEKPDEVKNLTEPPVTVGVPENFDVSKLEEEDPIRFKIGITEKTSNLLKLMQSILSNQNPSRHQK